MRIFEKLSFEVSKIENNFYKQYEIFGISTRNETNVHIYKDEMIEEIKDFIYQDINKIKINDYNSLKKYTYNNDYEKFDESYSVEYNYQFVLSLLEMELFKIKNKIYIHRVVFQVYGFTEEFHDKKENKMYVFEHPFNKNKDEFNVKKILNKILIKLLKIEWFHKKIEDLELKNSDDKNINIIKFENIDFYFGLKL